MTATASTQTWICAVVSGDVWHDDDGNRDVEVTAYPCSSDDQKSVCCKRAERNVRPCQQCARVGESSSGRHLDGIRGDECQGAVTVAVLETYYASRMVVEWELSMVAVVSPK